MTPLVLLGMCLLGMAVGGFLNPIMDRIPRGVPVLSNPVRWCGHCQRRLSPVDMVPVFRYLWLRGRCRHCHTAIPPRAFLVELTTGIFFLLVTYYLGLTAVAAAIMAYGSLLLAISVIDLEWTIVPDKLVLVGVVLALAFAPFGPIGEERSLGESYLSMAAGGALAFLKMLLIYYVATSVFKRAFGFGHVKLGGLIGLATGFPEVLVALYFCFAVGGIAAVLLLLKLKGRRDIIPYGPYLAAGALFALLVGADISDWYLDLL